MITYQDSLRNQINKLQNTINDLVDLKICGIKMGGGVIQEINSSKVIADNVKSNKIETNELKSTFFDSIYIDAHAIDTNILRFNVLQTKYHYDIIPVELTFGIIYNGTASTRGYEMFWFNRVLGFSYNNVIELISCVGQIENSSNFTITDTYKCSVGLDINNLMKCDVLYMDSTSGITETYNIKYIVGTLYSENSPSCIYQYATGYGDSNQLMRGNNLRFPTNHAIFSFKYMAISKN